MHETDADLVALQGLLDRSYAQAGPHLRSITTPGRRITAVALARELSGMVLLTLATVTADGRPLAAAVDGVFYRGAFHFGTSPDAVRLRHIRQRPGVSATHLPGEHFAVSVHGNAVELDLGTPDQAGLRSALLEVYLPRYGAAWEHFLDSGPVYARIDAKKLFAFSNADS